MKGALVRARKGAAKGSGVNTKKTRSEQREGEGRVSSAVKPDRAWPVRVVVLVREELERVYWEEGNEEVFGRGFEAHLKANSTSK